MTDETDQTPAAGPTAALGAADADAPGLCLQLLGETAAMVRFYARLPLPPLGSFDEPAHPPPFATSCRMLPVASLIITLPMALLAASLALTALPPIVSATIVIALGLAVTGALHEDGLADTIDGFGGGRDVAAKLAIMKDSRIGSYGAAALILALIARAGLYATLIAQSALLAATMIASAAILSRTLSLAGFFWLPPARRDGVAAGVGRPALSALAVATALTIGLLLPLALPLFASRGSIWILHPLLGIIVAGLVSLGLGRIAFSQIGGQTGDVLGAAEQVCEIVVLLALAARAGQV